MSVPICLASGIINIGFPIKRKKSPFSSFFLIFIIFRFKSMKVMVGMHYLQCWQREDAAHLPRNQVNAGMDICSIHF